MKWITREHPKIDRIACPWLLLRFIDADSEFHYVPADRVVACKELSVPYDIPGGTDHVGELCSFDALSRSTRLMTWAYHGLPSLCAAPTPRGSIWRPSRQDSTQFLSDSPPPSLTITRCCAMAS